MSQESISQEVLPDEQTTQDGVLKGKDHKKTNRFLYIIQAALEYFIALGVSGTYIPKIGFALGMEENTIVLLSSFASLGCGFQFLSFFFANKKPIKPWIVALQIANQLLFAGVWFIPLFAGNKTLKIVVFMVMLLSAHVLLNSVNAPTINWYMSFVDNKKRGSFTATKEIVSLLSGMLFTIAYGAIIDKNETNVAFLICGIVLLAITSLHTLVLVFTKEDKTSTTENKSFEWKKVFQNKSLWHMVVLTSLWKIAMHLTSSFMSVLQYNVMQMQTLTISIVTAVCSIIRAVCAKPMGKLADKKSFSQMLSVCLAIEIVAFLAIATYFPSANGVFGTVGGIEFYPLIICCLYYLCYYIGMAGLNSGLLNITFDYVEREHRTQSLAITNTVSGLLGFGATYVATKLQPLYAANPIVIGGTQVLFQQISSATAVLLVIVAICYNTFVVRKLTKIE